MTNFDLIFDNAGGITLQTDKYCHNYTNGVRLAMDVDQLLDSGSMPEYWDGNEPENRLEYDREKESSGQYRWITSDNVLDIVGQMNEEDRPDFLERISGYSEREFFVRLFELRDKKYLQQ